MFSLRVPVVLSASVFSPSCAQNVRNLNNHQKFILSLLKKAISRLNSFNWVRPNNYLTYSVILVLLIKDGVTVLVFELRAINSNHCCCCCFVFCFRVQVVRKMFVT